MSEPHSRQSGRSARKRLHNRLAETIEVFSACGKPKVKETLTEQARKGAITAAAKDLYLNRYRKELSQSAKFLTVEGCWSYFYRNLQEAKRFGLEAELRLLAAEAAAKFLGNSVRTLRANPA